MDHNKLWKILEIGVPHHLTYLPRNLYRGLEATVTTGHGTTYLLKTGKKVQKAVYCQPDYFTYMQSISCEKPGWMKHKLESRLPEEIPTTSDRQMAPL